MATPTTIRVFLASKSPVKIEAVKLALTGEPYELITVGDYRVTETNPGFKTLKQPVGYSQILDAGLRRLYMYSVEGAPPNLSISIESGSILIDGKVADIGCIQIRSPNVVATTVEFTEKVYYPRSYYEMWLAIPKPDGTRYSTIGEVISTYHPEVTTGDWQQLYSKSRCNRVHILARALTRALIEHSTQVVSQYKIAVSKTIQPSIGNSAEDEKINKDSKNEL